MSENGLTKAEFEQQAAELQARRQQENKTEPRHYHTGPPTSYASDRNRLGHQIADHASAWMKKNQEPSLMRFDRNDLIDSLPDAFALRANLPIRHAVHPLSSWASELSLQRLADQLQVRSLSSGEFGAAMSHGFSKVITAAYDSADNVAPMVADVVVPDFHETSFPRVDTVDLQEIAKSGNPDGKIPLQILNLAGAETGSVNTYRSRILVSRSLILSDSFNLISTLLRQLSAQAARLPQQLIARIISDNANLADGQPLLGSSNTAAAGVNLTGLGSAASILRLVHSDADNVLNLGPAVLLTRPENEMTWRSVLRSIELTGQPNIRLVSNSWLPTTSNFSYLLASPEESPVFVRMVFAKPLKPSVTSGQLPIEYDGTYLDFSVDFGIKAVSRLGLVRIPTT